MTIKQLKSQLPNIKKIIGYPEFPKDKDNLLIQAFIRRSFSQEHPEWQHNQVIELIGDSALDYSFVKIMCSPKSNNFGTINKSGQFVSTKDEGELTKLKSDYVNGKALAKRIEDMKLAQYLILGGADEKNNVRNKQATKEDLFEAIIGAVALACNFNESVILKVCTTMLNLNSANTANKNQNSKESELRKLIGDINKVSLENAKSMLLMLNQKKHISVPEYSNPKKPVDYDDDNNPIWEVSCKVAEYEQYWTCKRTSKKEASQAAAFCLLKYTILGYKQPK